MVLRGPDDYSKGISGCCTAMRQGPVPPVHVCGNIIEIEVMLSRQPDFLVVEIVDHDGMAIL